MENEDEESEELPILECIDISSTVATNIIGINNILLILIS